MYSGTYVPFPHEHTLMDIMHTHKHLENQFKISEKYELYH